MTERERWVIFIVRKVQGRPNQVRYQRLVALASRFKLVVLTACPLPEELQDVPEKTYLVKGSWRTCKLALEIVKELTAKRRQLYVHTQYVPSALMAGYLCSSFQNAPWLYDLWDHPSLCWAHFRGISRWTRIAFWYGVLRFMLCKTDVRVIAMHPEVSKFLPTPSSTCKIITTGPGCNAALAGAVQHTRQSKVDGRIRIVFVSSLSVHRGLGLLFEWVNEYTGHPVQLDIAGGCVDEESRAMLLELKGAGSAKADIQVDVHGEVSGREAMKLVAQSDIGLFVSDNSVLNYRYAYPVKILEYMSHGLVVVATDSLGVRALVRNEDNGFICANNLAEWRVAMERTINLCAEKSPTLYRVKAKARVTAEARSWNVINNKLLDDIEVALGW